MRNLFKALIWAGTGFLFTGVPVTGHSEVIVDIEVSFDVLNINASQVECATDGLEYTISGHLVAPLSQLTVPEPVVTVYLAGAMATKKGAYRMDLPGFDGFYDVAARMAELGHASVMIDRLGMGESDTPNGWDTCLGGEASVVNQVIQALRAGTYTAQAQAPIAFDRVVLAGHSGGGFIAPMVAYSFDSVDALLLLASAVEQGLPADLTADTAEATARCGLGGEEKRPGGPTGWVYYFDVGDVFFHDADRSIMDAFQASAERDSCGVLGSLATAVGSDAAYLGTIDVPVLLLSAEHDYAFPPEAVERQRLLYTGSPDATHVMIENAGHVYMLERGLADGRTSAERFRLEISDWLTTRGFLPEPGAHQGLAAGFGALWLLRRRSRSRRNATGCAR